MFFEGDFRSKFDCLPVLIPSFEVEPYFKTFEVKIYFGLPSFMFGKSFVGFELVTFMVEL